MDRKHGTAKTELSEIQRMGAKPQPNSGRGKTGKGDAVLDDYWLIDVKESAKTFGLSREVWAKLCTDAIKSGNLEPALNVVLGQPGEPRVRLYVISEDEMFEYRALRQQSMNGIIGDNE